MDPLSVTASIVTVIHLATKITTQCWDLHSEFKSARKDIDRIIDETNTVREVLERLARLVDDIDRDGDSRLSDFDVIVAPNGPFLKCHAELSSLKAELRNATSSNFKLGFLWSLKGKDVARRLDRISRIKQDLQLALTTDQT
ncbi:hypothetical protein K469DRAFT_679796 [Zopfia rhizophila CBS 207.26]|uniref:Azaphilone pigments biosynthesis cluster protein L N-terminal domain-containing protein n=1 Tax=Zopfia rhizophila CBS 207.26 TaxID=1314779 RepID=A0A6A6DC46_9PEZI|nr:hypothetical protein K469DRAFT_679796 [Zopfia rhizophila CBS 207.26]